MRGQRPPSVQTRSIGFLVAGVVLAPAIVWAIGLAFEQVLLVAALGAVAAATLRHVPAAEDPGWPEPPESDRDRGARRDVSRLSWSTSGDQVGGFTLRRLRDIGVRRTARHGLTLDDPTDRTAVVALIGEVAYGVLTAEVSEPVDGRRFAATMAALEALSPTDQPITPRSKRPNKQPNKQPDQQGTRGAA